MSLLFEEHNAACERAHLPGCDCFCNSAGHQSDLIVRAVTCENAGDNNLAEFLRELPNIYGGFHTSFRDASTSSRRLVPADLATIDLTKGRGATWAEGLLVDEALHSLFVKTAKASTRMTKDQRSVRESFVKDLIEGAFSIVGGSFGVKNVREGHLWCSIIAEACESLPTIPTRVPATSTHGKICYPRQGKAPKPSQLDSVRPAGIAHIQAKYSAYGNVKAKDDALRLMGAAACPDLWHHPAAVRNLVDPFVSAPSWPPSNCTTLAVNPGFGVLEHRWAKNGHW